MSVYGMIQAARGMCTDERPHVEIDRLLSRIADTVYAADHAPEGPASGSCDCGCADYQRLKHRYEFDVEIPIRELREENERLRRSLDGAMRVMAGMPLPTSDAQVDD